jgi:hypothetical protein
MDLVRTARATGAWYLGIAVTGLLGFLVLRPRVFDAADPGATLGLLAGSPGLARLAVTLELGAVLTQAVAAVFFYRLLRPASPAAAFAVAAFGVANAVIIGVSAIAMGVAVGVADGDVSLAGLDPAGAVALLQALSGSAWRVGAVFFGLWLIPMGWVAVRHGLFPRALGWFLVIGGGGYVLSLVVDVVFVQAPSGLVDALTVPATVGEFWMMGYLLVKGVRTTALAQPAVREAVAA